jgi:CS domain
MFKYVFIPADPSRAIEERSASKSGGLENDFLRKAAEDYFKLGDGSIDTDAERNATADNLLKQGIDPSQVSQIMSNLASSGGSFGSNVEIITVVSATPKNDYRAVSMYCDNRAGFKPDTRTNSRATGLLKSCGHDVDVRGDAFIGRALDDESKEWERLDFTTADLDSGAAWVTEAQSSNAGRNLNAYRSSGVMQQMLQGGSSGPSASAPSIGSSGGDLGSNGASSGCMSWNQSDDEIEVKFALPASLTKNELDVGIGSTTLRVRLRSGNSLPNVDAAYQAATGATLAGKIIVDESTWSMSSEGDHKVLTVTLSKGQPQSWGKLIA